MAVEQGVPIFVTLVGDVGRDQLPAELATLSVPEVIALPEDYWAEGVARLVREVRASLDAQVLAPHCREVAQSVAAGRLVAVVGPKLNQWSKFPWSPFAADEEPIVELFAELPAILRRKGYDPGLTIFSAGEHARLEGALRDADEEIRIIEDPYVQQPLLAGSIADFAAPFELRPRPSVTLVRAAEPPLALDPQPLLPMSGLSRKRLESGLSLQLWHCDLLFLGVGTQDGALAALAEERAPVANDSSWWVVGVGAIEAHGWEDATLVEADLSAYARALRRQVEALPPVE